MKRKGEHLKIVLGEGIEYQGSSGWEFVELVHESLPELALEEVETTAWFLGKRISFPLMITGMTGGAPQALKMNRTLARLAETMQIPMGVGSMRPLFEPRPRRKDYELRNYAPTIPLLGNLGGTQAREIPPLRMKTLLEELGYDGLCIHLNPAQETIQREGDRDFRGVLSALEAYHECFGERLIVKETGAGMSPRTLDLLKSLGLIWVDISGKGGTSWTRVEAKRNPADPFGELMGEWGIPAVVSLIFAVQRGFCTIASGGVRNPLDVAKALALGARLAGMARPVLLSIHQGGERGGVAFLQYFQLSLKKIMLLTGARDLNALRRVPRVLAPELEPWLKLDADLAPPYPG